MKSKNEVRALETINKHVRDSILIQYVPNNYDPDIRNALTSVIKKCSSMEKVSYDDLIENLKIIIIRFAQIHNVLHKSVKVREISTREIYELKNKCQKIKAEKNSGDFSLALRYFLFKNPLYSNVFRIDDNISNKDLKICLIGFGNIGQQFLDLALEYAQNIKSNLKVYIFSNNIEKENKFYLSERPALNDFFNIDDTNKDNSDYGLIKFEDIIDIVNDFENLSAKLKEIQPNYFFISLGNDELNINTCKKTISLITEYNNKNEVCVNYVTDTEDNKLPINYGNDLISVNNVPIKENYGKILGDEKAEDDINRMAFNAHLIWSGGASANFDKEYVKFKNNPYNHMSSISNVVSIKYKLFSLRIQMADYYSWSEKEKNGGRWLDAVNNIIDEFNKIKEKNKLPELMSMEHKRWVAEKICQGWTPLTNLEICPEIQSNQDKVNKLHVCIAKANNYEDDKNNLFKLEHSDWINKLKDNNLDDLDQVSLILNETYRKYINDTSVKRQVFDDLSLLFNRLQEIKNNDNVLDYYWQLNSCLNDLVEPSNLSSNTISLYNFLTNRLLESIPDSGNITYIKSALAKLNESLHPFIQYKKFIDYKKYDADLIEQIPFILKYNTDCRLDLNIQIPIPENIVSTDIEIDKLERIYKKNFLPDTMYSNIKHILLLNPKQTTFHISEENNPIGDFTLSLLSNYITQENIRTELGEPSTITIDKNYVSYKTPFDQEVTESFNDYSKILKNENILLVKHMLELKESKFHNYQNDIYIPILKKIYLKYIKDKDNWQDFCKDTLENSRIEQLLLMNTKDYCKSKSEEIFTIPTYLYNSICYICNLFEKYKIIKGYSIKILNPDLSELVLVNSKIPSDIFNELLSKKSQLHDVSSLIIWPLNCNQLRNIPSKMKKIMKKAKQLSEYKRRSPDVKTILNDSIDKIPVIGIFYDNMKFELSENFDSVINYLQNNNIIQKQKTGKTYVFNSKTYKNLLSAEGSVFEKTVFQELKMSGRFDDVVGGAEIDWYAQERTFINSWEIDCIVTKGQLSTVIECKSWKKLKTRLNTGDFEAAIEKLNFNSNTFAINRLNILLIESNDNSLNCFNNKILKGEGWYDGQKIQIETLVIIVKSIYSADCNSKIPELIEKRTTSKWRNSNIGNITIDYNNVHAMKVFRLMDPIKYQQNWKLILKLFFKEKIRDRINKKHEYNDIKKWCKRKNINLDFWTNSTSTEAFESYPYKDSKWEYTKDNIKYIVKYDCNEKKIFSIIKPSGINHSFIKLFYDYCKESNIDKSNFSENEFYIWYEDFKKHHQVDDFIDTDNITFSNVTELIAHLIKANYLKEIDKSNKIYTINSRIKSL